MKYCIVVLLCCFMTLKGYGQPDRFYAADMLYVKMKDDAGYSIRDKRLVNKKGQPIAAPGLDVLGSWSRVHQVSDAKLEAWRLTAQKNLNESLPDSRMEFHFRVSDAANRDKAMVLLTKLSDVEEVLRVPLPVKLPLPGNYTGLQRYGNSVATGIGADSVRIVYQNKGAGIRFCDIEYGFLETHGDLPPVTLIGPAPIDPFNGGGIDHGTAVLGEIISKDNGWGTTGLAPESKPYFSGAFTATSGYNVQTAITNAMDSFAAGDVLLLEQQFGGPNMDTITPETQRGLVPVEWYKPIYNAIKLASGNGIVVVEAAGNGAENLDDPVYNTGNGGHYPFGSTIHSGAIIVGAGGVGGGGSNAAARSRLDFSNYGSRVDVQGNGELITTTGYGDLYNTEGENYYYTRGFGGTSGASPIVTGAVILLQSVYKSQFNGAVLSPAQVSDLLKTTSKPQLGGAAPVSENIGPLPNVYAAIKKALDQGTGLPAVTGRYNSAVYPNPGAGRFSLVYAGYLKDALTVQVSSVSGQVVRRFVLGKGNNTVLDMDMSDQPAGIYFVRLTNGTINEVQRLVLTR